MEERKRHIVYALILVLSLIILNSCTGQEKTKVKKLDIKAYLDLADKDTIYPTDKQLAMLKEIMPREAFQPAPKISNREYWKGISETSSGKEYLTKALELLDKKPEVPITDSIYRLANKFYKRLISST